MFELSLGWLAVMIDVSLKGLLLAGMTGALLNGGRIRSSSMKHAAWLGVLAAMLGLPLLAPVLPAIPVPLPSLPEPWLTKSTVTDPVIVEGPSNPELSNTSSPEIHSREPREFDAAILVSDPQPVSMPEPAAPSRIEVIPQAPVASLLEPNADVSSEPPTFLGVAVVTWPAVLALIWMIGAFLLIARLALSIGLTGRLVQLATPIQSTELLGGTVFSFRGKNQRPVSLRESDLIFVPMTTGWIRPYILLPSTWQSWSAEKLGHVLVHEFAHVRRGDCWTALVAEFVTCVYWFHPLAWWLRRRLSVLAEECCDDAAVAATGDRTGYARHLLEIASLLCGRGRRLHYAGLAMARRSQVERRILTILDGNRPLSQRLTWSATLLIAALILPLVALAAALRPAEEASPDAPAAIASDGVDPESDTVAAVDEQQESAEAAALEEAPFHYAGAVVDEEGKPVPNAEIVLQYTRKFPSAEFPQVATSDAQGRFEFTRTRAEFDDSRYDLTWGNPTILARKEGYGFATGWGYALETTGRLKAERMAPGKNFNEELMNKATNVLTLLRDESPLRGRILNIEGKPVAGARVETLEIWEGKDGTLNDWHRVASERGSSYYTARNQLRWLSSGFYLDGPRGLAIPVVKTDADGWFTLKGLGKNRIAQIAVSGETIETVLLHVRSEPGELIKLPEDARRENSREPIIYLPHEFTQIIGPSIPVAGSVVDQKTGVPLAGVVVRANQLARNRTVDSQQSQCIRTTTDDEGRYRLTGLPFGSNDLIAAPPAGDRHLPGVVNITITPGVAFTAPELKLTPGVLVRGRVIDERTGKPIAGQVSYFAFNNNPFLKDADAFRRSFASLRGSYRTDEQGDYEIAVLPGKGIVAFNADDFSALPRGAGAKQIEGPYNSKIEAFETAPAYCMLNHHNFLAAIDLAADAEMAQVNLNVRSGEEAAWQVFDSEGRPLHNFHFYGEFNWANEEETPRSTWHLNASDRIAVKGYIQSQGRRLMFYDPAHDLVAILQLSGALPEKLSIPWQPAATIRGRLVDPDGKPVKNAVIRSRGLPSDAPGAGVLVENGSQAKTTDEEGRFEWRGLLPGLKYSAVVQVSRNRNGKAQSQTQPLLTDLVVEPGETKNLGDVTFDPSQPRKNVSEAKPEPAAQQKTADTTKSAKASSQETEFSGKVVDADGRPVAGAEVWFSLPSYSADEISVENRVRRMALSDSRGEFSFRLQPPPHADQVQMEWTHSACLVAKAAGHGCDWLSLAAFETAPVRSENREKLQQHVDQALGAGRFADRTLKLPREAGTVRGRLVDLEGRPLKGVAVQVEDMHFPDMTLLDQAFERSSGDLKQQALHARFVPYGFLDRRNWQALFSAVTTNDNGEFSLTGLGRDQLATVTLHGDNVAAERLFILGREMETKRLPHISFHPDGAQDVFVGLNFRYAVSPAVPVSGVVTEFPSGKPIAKATIFVERLFSNTERNTNVQLRLGTDYIRAVTDEQGRYQLKGIPPGEGHVLNVIPPTSEPWLMAAHKFSMAPGQGTATIDVRVFRGIWLEGRVTDAGTGKPVTGHVDYLALQKNPNLPEKFGLQDWWQIERFPIDKAGHYRTAGLRGPGVLLVRSFGKTVYPRSIGASQIEGYNAKTNYIPTSPIGLPLANWHLVQFIDPAVDAQSYTLDLTLFVGTAVVGRIVGPDGLPASHVEVLGQVEKNAFFEKLAADKFTIHNYDPAVQRDIFFKTTDESLVGHLNLQGEPPADLTVRLEPSVTVRGRLIGSETNRPAAGYSVYCDSSKHGKYRIEDVLTDRKGQFEIKGLQSGNVYEMHASSKGFFNGKDEFAVDLTDAKPGDMVELGNVTGNNARKEE